MNGQLDFQVRRDDLHTTRWHESALPQALAEQQVLLRVDAFAFTANNVTYAVAGDSMHYWQFFPAESGWGRIPVWGFGDVLESAHPEISAGERLYGYFPMSSHLVIAAGRVSARGLQDVSAHRAGLAAVYNQYARTAADPGYRADAEAAQMLYRPLFTTSFLLDDFLADNDFFGAERVMLTSASSKTSLGLAWLLHARRADRVRVVGLTSATNRDFVTGLGCYDEVVTYESIGDLPRRGSVIVDMAGNGAVLAAVHDHLGDALRYSCLVGATHWDARAGARDMAGPRPQLFFAPAHIERRRADWGPAGLEQRIAEAWDGFVAAAARWIHVEHGRGPADVERIYRRVLDGAASPAVGYVLSVHADAG
ncbi:MAG: DUF2855 family protein [Pseudomonadales bacterium]